MKKMPYFLTVLVLAVLLVGPSLAFADELVVYSARKEHLIKPLFDEYTKETGTKISFITDKCVKPSDRLAKE